MQENNTKSIHRLQEFITNKGISLNKLSVELGLSNSYFSKMVRNSGSIGSDIIEKIVRLYPELNIEWLLTGNGCMLKKDVKCTPLEQNIENKECTPFLSPQCTLNESTRENENDPEWLQKKIDRVNKDKKEQIDKEGYISDNDRDTIGYMWEMFDKKAIRLLYQQSLRALSNKIGLLKREQKELYNDQCLLLEAINRFKLGNYASKFEINYTCDELINRFNEQFENEFSNIEDKKLKAVFLVLELEDEIDSIRDSISQDIYFFNKASKFISTYHRSEQSDKKDDQD